jgi:hypothetical protein
MLNNQMVVRQLFNTGSNGKKKPVPYDLLLSEATE